MASLAELLAYKQKQDEMLNPQPSLSDRLESLSYAAGEGFADQLRGLQQLATHPVQSAKDIYSGVKYAVQNPRQAAQAAVEGLKGAVQSPESATRFLAQNFSPAELATGLGKLGTMREIIVHHGTPHRFEPTEANPLGEFDASKIGTGEGAAAYGHGIYFAENPEVANAYARMDSPFAKAGLKGQAATVAALAKLDAVGGPANAEKFLIENYEAQVKKWGKQDVDSAIASLKSGTLYKADLPDEMVDRMLDWDKPLSEQPQIMPALQKYVDEIKSLGIQDEGKDILDAIQMKGMPGEWFHEMAVQSFGPKNLALDLSRHGIPGIKYLDAGSRGTATGTRNFVVFPGEEKKIKILERK